MVVDHLLAIIDEGKKQWDDAKDIGFILKTAKTVMDGALGTQHRYAAFHYRSRLLEEGRQSPCSIGSDKRRTKTKVLSQKCEPVRVNDDKWISLFLDNLLRAYLYVYGRDISFSENCILAIERQFRGSKRKLRPLEADPVSLVIRTRDDEYLPKNRKNCISIPPELFNCLTWRGHINKRLWEAVAKVLHAKMQCQHWDEKRGFDIPEYRMVWSRLEKPRKVGKESLPFSELKNRAISAAYYLYEKNKPKSIRQAERAFSQTISHRKGELDFFFRVIQAACTFTPLIGESLTVIPFLCLNGGNRSLRDLFISTFNSSTLNTAWQNVVTHLSNNNWPDDCFDQYSGLTAYWDNRGDIVREDRDQTIKYLRLLSVLPNGQTSQATKRKTRILPGTLTGIVNDDRNEDNKKALEELKSRLGNEKYHWLFPALAAADVLRSVRHEGKRLALNVVVGTELEFRATLVPVYKFTRNDKSANIIRMQDPTESNLSLRSFQDMLRVLVRRYFTLLDARFRFLCIARRPKGTLELCYLADAMESMYASTVSETLRRLVEEGGFALARVESSGKAVISVRDGSSYRTIFSCRPLGRGFDITVQPLGKKGENDLEVNRIYMSDLSKQLVLMSSKSSWNNFVTNIMTPTVEVVSEDPGEGGIIVLSPDLKKLNKGGAKSAKYFEMPEGEARLCIRPDDSIVYIDRETFRRLVVQDGATLIDAKSGAILSRIQLLGALGKREFNKVLNSEVPSQYKDRPAEWGTRHISALQFVASILYKRRPRIQHIHCFVISHDGDVHYMTDKTRGLFTEVMIG